MKSQKQFIVTPEILASLTQRFFDWVIDMIMLVILFLIILTFVAAWASPESNKAFQTYILINVVGQITFFACLRLFYYNVFEVFFARSVGKFITGAIVVDENGNIPNHESILIRSICRLIPFYEFSLLGIPIRGWHDSISKTYVVDKKLLEQAKRKFYTAQEATTEE